MRKYIIFYTLCLLLIGNAHAQFTFPYKNPALPIEQRVNDLLQRMTIEEKFWQMFMIPGDLDPAKSNQYHHGIFGFQVSAATAEKNAAQQMLQYNTKETAEALAKKINAIQKYFVDSSRLGIPIIPFDEALHGLVRDGATVFPQAIGLAATWDTALMNNVANTIAKQTKIRGIRQVLSPVINIANDVRWGRTEETYGEDPFLTSAMGIAFINAFEKMNIIATPKHFIANIGDGGRDSYPVNFNERLLNEIYFPPFETAIKKAGARSIMTAYNSLNGIPCSMNNWLLNEQLKIKWGFTGFVISDASAVGGANVLHYTAKDYEDASQQAINNGLDVIFQTDYDHYKLFMPPFLDGRIEIKKIDASVKRILTAKFQLGLFENPYVPENNIERIQQKNEYKDLAKKAAIESIVLLKNENAVLPFRKNISSIAVIGTDAVEARTGGYSGPGNGKQNILDGIKQRAGADVQVMYAPGCGRKSEEWIAIPASFLSNGNLKGLKGSYFNNINLEGNPVLTRNDQSLDFNWTLFSPASGINLDFYSVRWEGLLKGPQTGDYKIGLDGNDGFRLYLNDQLVIDNWQKQTYSTRLISYHFEKDKMYKIKVEFFEPDGNAHIKLIWNAGIKNDWKEKINEAVALAAKSSVAVIITGITEGEFQDRAMLSLPGHQEELIKAVAATGKPLVVVLTGGSAITMNNWLPKVGAVLNAWYPGEEGGNAVAAILFGDENPAGRLPITYPISEAQLPLVYNHQPTGRGDDYNNLSGLPLFPFGFGLSYTHFEYSNLRFDKDSISKNDSTIVRFSLKNTGPVAGDEVVQLYIRDLLSSVARPVMELKGFKRIHLAAGETKEISFSITRELLSMLDENLNRVVEPGDFRIMIGASSRDIRLKKTLVVSE
ncbi:MAG: glycoside hydrolase family 3 N-terminal domain-containing protein [Ferruginibacter sp.]